MKTLKQIKEDIVNVSSGIGVRGFGDVSGTPKVGDESENNPHIDRVIQGAKENSALVNQFVKNNTDGIHTFDDDHWWKNREEAEKYVKQLKEEGEGTVTTDVGPGMGDNNEVFRKKTKQNNKNIWPMFRRRPLQVEEEIANVTGAAVATDQPVVNRAAQEKWTKENSLFARLMSKKKKKKKNK